MNPTVIHNPSENRFEYRAGGDIAVCEYELIGNVWHFNHTLVPDSMRGQGIAAQLVETALNYVDAHQGKIVPKCSYVASYIQKNPSFARLLGAGQVI